MLTGVEKLSEKFLGFDAVRCVGFFSSGECTDVKHLPVGLDVGRKSLSALPDSFVTRSVLGGSSHISVILACCGFTKIRNTVVQSVAVNVVNLFRKVSVNPQPHKPVSQFSLPIGAELIVSVFTDAPSYSTSGCSWNSNKSNKISVFAVVVEQFSDFIVRNFVAFKFSHVRSFVA